MLGADLVVVLAEYSLGGRLRPEALNGAAAWAAAGVPTLVVAARDAWSPKTLQVDPLPDGVAVVRRPNVGYDFGSWSTALAAYAGLASKRLVVLTNDSMAGPFGPLDDLVARIEASSADLWAPTDTELPVPHLHSYLLAFRGGVLARDPLRGFFAGVRPQESKRAVIHTYEIGLSNLVRAHGLTTEVGWTKDDLGVDGETDSLLGGWALLLTHGFPFVKRLLLEGKQFADVRDAVPVGVRQEYGVQLG